MTFRVVGRWAERGDDLRAAPNVVARAVGEQRGIRSIELGFAKY
jgi:hypothetical protein